MTMRRTTLVSSTSDGIASPNSQPSESSSSSWVRWAGVSWISSVGVRPSVSASRRSMRWCARSLSAMRTRLPA